MEEHLEELKQRAAQLEEELQKVREEISTVEEALRESSQEPKRGTKRKRSYAKKKCKHEGCNTNSRKGGLCIRHGAGALMPRCKHEGCNKWQQSGYGQFCIGHYDGPPIDVKQCSVEGCETAAYTKGLCCKHGGKVRARCKMEGCDNLVRRHGYCTRHHPDYVQPVCSAEGCIEHVNREGQNCALHRKKKPATCKQEGCNSQAVQGGVCQRHGAKVKKILCNHEGCSKCPTHGYGKFCKDHGPPINVKICSVVGCTSVAYNRTKMLCCKHGGKIKRKCSMEGCSKPVEKQGKCRMHQPDYVPKICAVKGCMGHVAVAIQNGMYCVTHDKKPICSVVGCERRAHRGGVCYRHGAPVPPSKLCIHPECKKRAIKEGLCKEHHGNKGYAGLPPPLCKHESCANIVSVRGMFCDSHDDGPICTVVGCDRSARKGKVCYKHGTPKPTSKLCIHPECKKWAQKEGYCNGHHGHVKYGLPLPPKPTPKLCKHSECKNLALNEGYCHEHFDKLGYGAGLPLPLCKHGGCSNYVKKPGLLCDVHTVNSEDASSIDDDVDETLDNALLGSATALSKVSARYNDVAVAKLALTSALTTEDEEMQQRARAHAGL